MLMCSRSVRRGFDLNTFCDINSCASGLTVMVIPLGFGFFIMSLYHYARLMQILCGQRVRIAVGQEAKI